MNNSFRGEPQPGKNNPVNTQIKKIYRSEDLFKDDREIIIMHGETQYRLQITKAGKLILNK